MKRGKLHCQLWPHRRQRPQNAYVALPTVTSLCPLHRRGLVAVGCLGGDVTLVDRRQPKEHWGLIRGGGFSAFESNPEFSPTELSCDAKEKFLSVNVRKGSNRGRLVLHDLEASLKGRDSSESRIFFRSFVRRAATSERLVRIRDVCVTEKGNILALAKTSTLGSNLSGALGDVALHNRFIRIDAM